MDIFMSKKAKGNNNNLMVKKTCWINKWIYLIQISKNNYIVFFLLYNQITNTIFALFSQPLLFFGLFIIICFWKKEKIYNSIIDTYICFDLVIDYYFVQSNVIFLLFATNFWFFLLSSRDKDQYPNFEISILPIRSFLI